ncbi:hypothetical protein DVH24_042156 [Malus domestica]|uniref:Uncharacterized protein n=1 Tax=Malus domestica TaxID=3750 RepID=A0A498J0C7_MALDO|nr:hypothetical protein DVH24_042156 [Malus domestica]
MLIPAPDLMGTTTSTPAVWEFTTSALAPVLHHDRLGKQISSVSDPMSSLGVCQDMMQTTITMRTEPLQDLKRIFLKVATALEEQWVDGLSRQLSLNFFGTQLRDGSISAYFASKQLPGVLTSRCLRNNHPHQIVLRLPNRQLAIPCVQIGVIELVVKSLIQSYSGVMSRI